LAVLNDVPHEEILTIYGYLNILNLQHQVAIRAF